MTLLKNRAAYHEYFIEEEYEAGLMLEGWEIKAIRAGRAHIAHSHVVVHNGEVWLIGANITPLPTAVKYTVPDPTRTRKLLLTSQEINRLIGKVERVGYTIVPLNLHMKRGRAKLQIGLAKGKKLHDKRQVIKTRDIEREIDKTMKNIRK